MKTRFAALSLLAATALLARPAAGQDSTEMTRLIRGVTGAASIGKPLDEMTGPAVERYAIVVGNDSYQNVRSLQNAENDAHAMAAFLRRQGFRVIEHYDLDKRGFEGLLRQVLIQVGQDSEILFYYAGHGIQIGRRNYLIPVDSKLTSAYDVPFETVTLDSLVSILGARARLQLVILDSCRNNPFGNAKVITELDPTLFEARDGFNPMSAPVNTLLAYSTSPGHVALDGDSGNSPFTTALLRAAEAEPDQSISQILERVRRDVYAETGGAQVPWESSTLVEPFRFAAAGDMAAEAAPAAAKPSAARAVALDPGAVAMADDAMTLDAPLERRLALGPALQGALALGPDDRVSFGAPSAGRLVLEGTILRDYAGEALSGGELAGLVYEYVPEQTHVTGPIEDYVRHDRLSLSLEAGSAAPVTHELALNLAPDPCDYQAGDWLDPDGIGLARYPNELEPEAALAACQAAVAAAPGTGRFQYQLGRALLALLRYDEARHAFEAARDLGHTRAWQALGDLVAKAAAIEGGAADSKAGMQAMELFAEGAARGDPYAYHALGKQLLRHGETDHLRRQGFELLSRAIELGHTFSMNELGYYFLKEDSPEFDPERGLRYLTESAARGDIYGYHNLGLVYDRGLGGIPADADAARRWYEKAAEGGHPVAPVNLGRMYFQGRFGAPDLARAIEWYDRGLERGAAWGGTNAAWIIANKRPKGYTAADAAIRAAKAATLRDAGAAHDAQQVLAGLATRDIDRATQVFLGELGNPVAVDGVIGPKTQAAIDALLAENDVAAAEATPVARLTALARVYWKHKKFRVDLY